MSVQRLVRVGVAGVFVMLTTALLAATQTATAAETAAVRSDGKTAADKQATALISPRFGEVIRPDTTELARTQVVATRATGANGTNGATAGLRQDATARADDDAADMAYLEMVALVAAGLIAVLSLSRRRNL
jgi:hypothetical protein